jgi:hypothetical protein
MDIRQIDLVQEVKEVVALQNPNEKKNRLERLSSIFEHGRELNKVDLGKAVQILLDSVLQIDPDDKEMRESFFHAINSAVVFHDIGNRVNWEELVSLLPSLENTLLEYALNLLGLSGQEKYLPVVEPYTHHADPEVREWAEDAINEITYRVAHHPDTENGG